MRTELAALALNLTWLKKLNNPIKWKDIFRSSREIVTKQLLNNEKVVIHRGKLGKLIVPPGWRKVCRSKVTEISINYRLNALPEQQVPYIDRSAPQIEQDRITSEYYWKTTQYRMEIFSSEDFGKSWVLENIVPIKRPQGFPIQDIDILASLRKSIFPTNPSTMIAVAFRDVGWGLPQLNQDFFTCRVAGITKEKMYEYVPYTSPTSTTQITSERLPASNTAMKSAVPVRTGRKRLIFQVITTSPTLQTVIKYGAVADTGVQQVTITGAGTVAGLDNYSGEISFSQNATFNASLVVNEFFN